jgi:hypothetical protein
MSVVRGKLHDYVVVDLSVARTDECLQVAGDTITVQSCDGELYAKINDTNEPAIALHTIRYIDFRPSSFRRIYLTNTAQEGKSAVLRIGKDASFLMDPTRSGVVGLLNAAEERINPATEDTLATRASEATLSSLNSKVQTQTADLFVKDVSVGTTKVQIDADSKYRDEVTLLADSANTAAIKIGTSTSQLYPLAAGASVRIKKTSLNLIYAVAVSGTQLLHVLAGGS